jgi:putative heme-binding domain-containing protein
VRVVAFGEDAAGEVYALDYDAGTIHTIAKNDTGTTKPEDFPRKLSQTGLFTSVKDHAVAPGVVPFRVNAARWDDDAISERFAAFPNGGTMTWLPRPMSVPGSMFTRQYEFPANAVLGRTVSLTGKRLETQVLHFDGKTWRGYTYAWNPAGTDADLVPADGGETEVSDGKQTKPWTFASRSQCMVCHNPWAQHALAFNPEQLNRVADTPLGKRNQLVAFEELGLIRRTDDKRKPLPPLTEPTLAKVPTLTDPHDPSADLDKRARSYLHVNCGHCHRFGGGGSVDIELHATASLKKALDVPPVRGTFDLPDAKILAPGDPHRSVLFYRLAKFGRGRMPHLGSESPDPRGVTLIRDWVRGLPGGSPAAVPDPAKWTDAELAAALASPAPACDLAVAVGDEHTPAAVRTRILTAAGKLPPGNLRDLFDGHFPTDGKERKIGPNPRPGSILSAEGNSERGRLVYSSKAVQCQTCHKLDGQGGEVGPDLSQIGQLRSRQELLESLLDPSRQVDPKFQAFLVRTVDGRAFTGLLLKRDAKEVVLKDSQANEVRLPADDIESLQPSRESLMPAGPIADLTRQQAADLLAYLASRK